MSGVYAWINLAEAALWGTMALLAIVLAASRRATASYLHTSRLGLVVLAFTLAAFGASDVVETYTGAWWRPWWLLVWKAACVLCLGTYGVTWLAGAQRRRATRDAECLSGAVSKARSDPRKPSSTH